MELTVQQQEFLANYTDPNSETFGNALQSALRAKYSQEYAESITHQMPDWLSENLGKTKRLKKAERTLDRTLEYEPVNEDGKIDNSLLKTQTIVAMFLAETVGKKVYSKRNELTGADGQPINITTIKYGDSPQVSTEDLSTSTS